MRELFTDIYKKVLGFFQTEEKEAEESKTVAVNRMKLVLMQDRTNLTPFLLERMRGEMIDLLSRYVEMDKELLELNFAQEGESMALMLSIPVIRAREEEEIKEILEAEDAAKAEAEAQEETEGEDETSEEGAEEETDESEDVEEDSQEAEDASQDACEVSEETEETEEGSEEKSSKKK